MVVAAVLLSGFTLAGWISPGSLLVLTCLLSVGAAMNGPNRRNAGHPPHRCHCPGSPSLCRHPRILRGSDLRLRSREGLNMDHPIYALAYALGYGLGTFLGITIEQRLAFGLQVVSLFTRNGAELAKGLISAGYRVAKVQGHIRDGEASILYVEVQRKQTRKLISEAVAIDETCFCVVNDVPAAGFANRSVNPKMSRRQKETTAMISNT